jgi:hypothetical protein
MNCVRTGDPSSSLRGTERSSWQSAKEDTNDIIHIGLGQMWRAHSQEEDGQTHVLFLVKKLASALVGVPSIDDRCFTSDKHRCSLQELNLKGSHNKGEPCA